MEQQSVIQTLEALKSLESNVAPKTFEMLVEAQRAQSLSGLIFSVLFLISLLAVVAWILSKIKAAIVAKLKKEVHSSLDRDILNADVSVLNVVSIMLIVGCFLLSALIIFSIISEGNAYTHPEAAVVRQMFGGDR